LVTSLTSEKIVDVDDQNSQNDRKWPRS